MQSTIKDAICFLGDDTSNAEIAFFGGSFTAIDSEYMISLLDATTEYIDRFKGIRISTRPDYIDDDILELLKTYKVTSIELGAQSMDDAVLCANNRGHSRNDIINASKLIKMHGFSLGLQMMTGLYKSSSSTDLKTAEEFIKLEPDTVRIYPTIVIADTKLHQLLTNDEYTPQTLSEAVDLCSDLLTMFYDNDISVIRLGLHHSESLESSMVAGPYHPSFKELCESKILLNKALSVLESSKKRDEYDIYVSPRCVSKMIGNKRSNILRLHELGYNVNIIQDDSVEEMELILK
ncbi:MAG: radical SAM protein [Ruminococcus sp.]|nr:radical SAM protein [Ruminococcus sp.]